MPPAVWGLRLSPESVDRILIPSRMKRWTHEKKKRKNKVAIFLSFLFSSRELSSPFVLIIYE